MATTEGIWRIDSAAQAAEPFRDLSEGVQIIAEEFVDFTRPSKLEVHVAGGPAAAYRSRNRTMRWTHLRETDTSRQAKRATGPDTTPCAVSIRRTHGGCRCSPSNSYCWPPRSVVVSELAMRPKYTGTGRSAAPTPRSSRTTCAQSSISR